MEGAARAASGFFQKTYHNMSDDIKIFIQAVADMLDLQKKYFRTRNTAHPGAKLILEQAKVKERQVDAMLQNLSEPVSSQQSLF